MSNWISKKTWKTYFWKKHGKMELRNRNFSTAFCSQFFTFYSHFQNACFSHFFPSAFSKRIFSHVFTLFHKNVKNEKTCEKMRFENALGKNVKEMRFENALGKKREKRMWKMWKKHIWTSSWEGGTLIFWGPVLLQLLCCLPTSAGWKSERSSSNRSFKIALKRYIFSHCFYIFKIHVFPHCFRIFNSTTTTFL